MPSPGSPVGWAVLLLFTIFSFLAVEGSVSRMALVAVSTRWVHSLFMLGAGTLASDWSGPRLAALSLVTGLTELLVSFLSPELGLGPAPEAWL